MHRGQAFDAFKLLIAAVVAGAILVIIFNIFQSVALPSPDERFDARNARITAAAFHPAASTQGTVFIVNAEVKSAGEQCFQPKAVKAAVQGKEVLLVDDGKHGDGRRGDCVFGGEFDSVNTPIGNYTGIITVEDTRGVSKESDPLNFSITDNACVTVEDHGPPEKKLDVVFIGDRYDDLNRFDSDVRIHKDFILSVAPFSEERTRINVHEIRAATRLGCQAEQGVWTCDDSIIAQQATQCPWDEIIVLVNEPVQAGTANPYAYAGRLYPEISLHELGHALGPGGINLVDEYSYGISGADDSFSLGSPPNCDEEPCSKWAGVPGTGCFAQDKFGETGCTYTEWRRPVQFDKATGVSIMEGATLKKRSELTQSSEFAPVGFDPVSYAYVKKLLEEYEK
jgi:hypothetical protein